MSGKIIAKIRKDKGFTQQTLADIVGITRQQISAIETGQSLPSVSTAKAIADILGIRWDIFFEPDASANEDGKAVLT